MTDSIRKLRVIGFTSFGLFLGSKNLPKLRILYRRLLAANQISPEGTNVTYGKIYASRL
jgi:hypothetical protein